MKQRSLIGIGIKSLKAFILAGCLFLILSAVFGALIRFSPLPERHIMYYGLLSLCVSCLFLGVYAGNLLKNRGFLFGAVYSAIFVFLITLLISAFSETEPGNGFFQLRYLACLLSGSIGGAFGVNQSS